MSQRDMERAERIRIRFKERYAAATTQRDRVAAATDYLRSAAVFVGRHNPEAVTSFLDDAVFAAVNAADSILAMTNSTPQRRRA